MAKKRKSEWGGGVKEGGVYGDKFFLSCVMGKNDEISWWNWGTGSQWWNFFVWGESKGNNGEFRNILGGERFQGLVWKKKSDGNIQNSIKCDNLIDKMLANLAWSKCWEAYSYH